MRIDKSFLVRSPAKVCFQVVNEAERYREFIKDCKNSYRYDWDENNHTYKGVLEIVVLKKTVSIVTENTYQENKYISLKLIRGPFSN